MPLTLTALDREMLAGRHGEAVRMAISIVVQMAEVEGAGELMDVTRAHIDGALYLGESSLEFAESFARLGGRVVIPTTMNIGPMEELGWRCYPVPEQFAEKGARIMRAYIQMGCRPTWTCAPYQAGVRPAFGEQIAWAESNAIVFANSVLGARTNRYGDYIDLCAALTGRVPRSGLHLTQNRCGQILFRLTSLPRPLMLDDGFYPVLGSFVGSRSGQKVPVLEGLPRQVTENQLKALGAAAASSGRVALFHAIGVTPEAPTLEAAFLGGRPEEVVEVTLAELQAVREGLSTAVGERLDLVALGCPHFSPAEFARLAELVKGKERHPAVEVMVTTSRFVREVVQRAACWPELERFGVRVIVDSCILHMPVLRPETRVLMTNSGKYAYYIPGLLGRQVAFGTLEDCVRSAVMGRVWRDDRLWGGGNMGGQRPHPRPLPAAGRGDTVSLSPWERAGVRADPAAQAEGPAEPLPPTGPCPHHPGGRDARAPGSTEHATLHGRVVVAGSAQGIALVAEEPLSFWGGLDPATGEVIDRRHPLSGQIVTGRVLVVPYSRGSSTTSTVLLEAIRAGTAPAAIVASCADPLLALGSVVAGELYHRGLPVVALEEADYLRLRTGDWVSIKPGGALVPRGT